MTVIRTSNNPDMLIWARDEVGYSVEQGAEAVGVSIEQLTNAEAGQHQLTLNQLRRASEVYDFPFGYFYLSKPPKEKEYKPVPDYRTDPKYAGISHYRTNLEIKKCRERRSTHLDLAERLDLELSPFQVLQKPKSSSVGTFIRERLNIDPAEIKTLRYEKTYSYWKSKIEDDGVLVYETQYIPKETGIIGASLFYNTLPVIIIRRGEEFNSRKLFTLMHEYAHLLLGESGLNDNDSLTTEPAKTGEDIEYRCNQLASEILMPSELIDYEKYNVLSPKEMMETLGSDFKVTFSSAAICLKRKGLISQQVLSELLEYRRQEHKNRAKTKKSKEVKIPREIIMKIDMGKPMFNLVLSAYNAGQLDLYDTSKLLHLRAHKIDKLLAGSA